MGYNIIRKLFGKKERIEEEPKEHPPVSIVLSITEGGHLDVVCNWQEEDDTTTLLLSELLFYLSSGFVSPYIESILLQHMSENPESEEFISAVFEVSKEMTNVTAKTEDHPLVRPSQVFREG